MAEFLWGFCEEAALISVRKGISFFPQNLKTLQGTCLCFMALGIQKFELRLCWRLELQSLTVLSLVSEHVLSLQSALCLVYVSCGEG